MSNEIATATETTASPVSAGRPVSPEAELTDTLADFVTAVGFDRLPEQLSARLPPLLLDFCGNAAFGGSGADSSGAIGDGIRRLADASGSAIVIGQADGLPRLYAALANGAFAHSLDMDDTNIAQTGHPGAPVIAAALAEAERLDVRAAAFFEAMAVGYEIACRLGAALGPGCYARGFHITSVSGIFGAVAAVAKLRGFDKAMLKNAWGLALSKAAGSMQYLANGSWNKRLHPGFAAHDSLLCVELAAVGVIGAAQPFDGRFGLFTGYTAQLEPEFLTDGLGTRWLATDTAIKPYPSCRLTHGAVDAAIALRDKVADDQRAEADIEISISEVAMSIVGGESETKRAPRSSVDAQFSAAFQTAAAWIDGRIDWSTYDRLDDPVIRSLTRRIRLTCDPDMTRNGATLRFSAGSVKDEKIVRFPLGEPENWLDDNALATKFHQLADPVYGAEHAGRIADAVMTWSADTRIGELTPLLRRQI